VSLGAEAGAEAGDFDGDEASSETAGLWAVIGLIKVRTYAVAAAVEVRV